MVASSRRRARRRGSLLVLCSLLLLVAQPVVGDGPGPDPQTVYTGDPIDLETEAAEGDLALHPAVNGDFVVAGTVRAAANGTFERPADDVSGNLRTLTGATFYWDSTGEQYFAIDAALQEGVFRLTAGPVPARTVAESLAVPAEEASDPVARAARAADRRAVADEGRTRPVERDPTLVATDDGYVFVTRSIEAARDPYRTVKLTFYALAGSGVVAGVLLPVAARRRVS
ncbi:hypothetical protein BRC89_05410 [Halobacteriales archaeon QS_4_70_19]|nr:MAG: hypothetical protein BRC89_05410 [Halobacteriales archaeon QS_4_70_19]